MLCLWSETQPVRRLTGPVLIGTGRALSSFKPEHELRLRFHPAAETFGELNRNSAGIGQRGRRKARFRFAEKWNIQSYSARFESSAKCLQILNLKTQMVDDPTFRGSIHGRFRSGEGQIDPRNIRGLVRPPRGGRQAEFFQIPSPQRERIRQQEMEMLRFGQSRVRQSHQRQGRQQNPDHGFSHRTNHSRARTFDSGRTWCAVLGWMRRTNFSSAPAAW